VAGSCRIGGVRKIKHEATVAEAAWLLGTVNDLAPWVCEDKKFVPKEPCHEGVEIKITPQMLKFYFDIPSVDLVMQLRVRRYDQYFVAIKEKILEGEKAAN
jgi:hypothetical protein